jgi:hypothetical protein
MLFWIVSKASSEVALSIAIADNASTDGTVALIREWAAGVNAALVLLSVDTGLDRFWILNPDSMVSAGTA